ncbi:MAG: DUF86 domain-containing protein [Chloroflexi bacterium]|nr:DUF86 domain-containing protein [Chloroflexota bacterium]
MPPEFSGIERRLNELNERLARLRPLQVKTRDDFLEDAYLRDIVERNLEIAAQCCIDISHRIITIEQAQKPQDYYEAVLRMGELGVVPPAFARRMAPIAGFRNILIHEYLSIDWDITYARLQNLDELGQFARFISEWLAKQQHNG